MTCQEQLFPEIIKNNLKIIKKTIVPNFFKNLPN